MSFLTKKDQSAIGRGHILHPQNVCRAYYINVAFQKKIVECMVVKLVQNLFELECPQINFFIHIHQIIYTLCRSY